MRMVKSQGLVEKSTFWQALGVALAVAMMIAPLGLKAEEQDSSVAPLSLRMGSNWEGHSQVPVELDSDSVEPTVEQSVADAAALPGIQAEAKMATPPPSSVKYQKPRLIRLAENDPARRFEPGTIVVRARERALYFIEDSEGHATRYSVAVPKKGKEWKGWARVAEVRAWPDWSPPPDVKRDHPELPDVIPGGAENNPMGAMAILLDRGSYAIHGTSPKMRDSIGTAASYGCVRMLNEDVVQLAQKVRAPGLFQEGAAVLMEQ